MCTGIILNNLSKQKLNKLYIFISIHSQCILNLSTFYNGTAQVHIF